MSREEMLKNLILCKYKSIREFSKKVGLPSTTVNSILKNIGGTSIDKIILICNDLNIDVEKFSPKLENKSCSIACTPIEQKIIELYRSKPEMQSAVNKLLGVEEEYAEDFIIA